MRFKLKEKGIQMVHIPGEKDLPGHKYPFTGHGFTAGKEGKIGVPEFKVEDNEFIDMSECKIYSVDQYGNETLEYELVKGIFEKNKY